MKILFCLVVSLVALGGCKGTGFGLAIRAPLFGELQFRADPVQEVQEAVATVADATGVAPKEKVK